MPGHVRTYVHVNIYAQVHVNIYAQVHVNIYAQVHVNISMRRYTRDHFHIAANQHAISAANLLQLRSGGNPPGHTTGARQEELGEQKMKRMQNMEINWKWFQVNELTATETKTWVNHWVRRFNYDSRIYSDIYDAYKRPSEAKVSIWREWEDWAREVNVFAYPYEVKNLSICATTNQMFSVCAIIREFDRDEVGNYITVATYIMKVTKYHNYLYRLASDEDGEDIEVCW